MPQEEQQQPAESEWSELQNRNSLDSLRLAGCKVINRYLPGFVEGADQAEVFGITKGQFDRAFDLEWIRLGRPENAVVFALYKENDRLRGELSRIGVMIDAAVIGHTRSDEPENLRRRLDAVRSLTHQVKDVHEFKQGIASHEKP